MEAGTVTDSNRCEAELDVEATSARLRSAIAQLAISEMYHIGCQEPIDKHLHPCGHRTRPELRLNMAPQGRKGVGPVGALEIL